MEQWLLHIDVMLDVLCVIDINEDYQDDDLAYEYNDNLEEFIENAKLELEEMFDYQEDNYKSYKIKIVVM